MAGGLGLLRLVLLLSISFSMASNIATAENQSPPNGGYRSSRIQSEDAKASSENLHLSLLHYIYVYRSACTERRANPSPWRDPTPCPLNMPSEYQGNLFYADTLADIVYADTSADILYTWVDTFHTNPLADACVRAGILYPDPWADTLSTPRDSIGLDVESIMGLRMHLKELTNHPPELPRSRKSKMRGPLVLMPLRRWLPMGLKGPFVP